MNKLCFTFLTLALGTPTLANAGEQAAPTDAAAATGGAKTTVAASGSLTANVKVSDQDALGDDILAVINLPIAAADAREAGVEETDLKAALDVTRETGLSAGDASEVVAEEAEQTRTRGAKKGFGQWVKMQVAAGLRGKALAAKIKARKADTAELDEKKIAELTEKLEKQRELNRAWRAKAQEKRTELVAKGKKKVILHEERNEKLKAKIQAAQVRNEERGDAVEGVLDVFGRPSWIGVPLVADEPLNVLFEYFLFNKLIGQKHTWQNGEDGNGPYITSYFFLCFPVHKINRLKFQEADDEESGNADKNRIDEKKVKSPEKIIQVAGSQAVSRGAKGRH